MNPDSISALANQLVSKLEHYHKMEVRHPEDVMQLRLFIGQLKERGFIDREGAWQRFVIRSITEGSLLVVDDANKEIVFTSTPFANRCFSSYRERQYDVYLLKIVRQSPGN